MFIGKVIGEVWASRRASALPEVRLLTIAPLATSPEDASRKVLVVAGDRVGAGIGEQVVVAYGRAARNALGMDHEVAVEAAVVGIVDDYDSGHDALESVGGGRP